MSDLTYSVMLIVGFVALVLALRAANWWLEHHRPTRRLPYSDRARP